MQSRSGVGAAVGSNVARGEHDGVPSKRGSTEGNDGTQEGRAVPPQQPPVFSAVSAVLVLTLITIASVGSFSQQAAAQSAKSLQAYLGFLEAKPKALPLARPTLPMTHAEGTESYSIRAPRSATGITLTVVGDSSSKATAARHSAPNGKKLKRKAWSRKQRSKRLHVLSFDGLGFGVNSIQISVNVPKRPELAKTYNVMVTRAETLGSDPTLTALGVSESDLVPAFASETKSYKAEVPYRVTALGVTVQRKEAGTEVELRGIASDGTELMVDELTATGMTVGRNRITILATAEDGSTTDSYTVEVVPAATQQGIRSSWTCRWRKERQAFSGLPYQREAAFCDQPLVPMSHPMRRASRRT